MNDISYNVLLVDDDKFLLDMYAMKFKQHGFNVQTSLSGKDALTLLRGGFAADAVLFDLIMPECDGYTFLQSVEDEKLAPKAVKIALTNQSTDAEKEKIKQLGADMFIVKAMMIPSEVVNTVDTALKGRAAA